MQEEGAYLCGGCGEDIVIPLDISAGHRQEYVEDCPVCCRPNMLHITWQHGVAEISAHPE
jgi:short subunit dehydrogenase-like uncharacterized protein